MLKNLSVKNFKSWKDLPNMEFGKVTALFGPNNSGKTSLIKLLLMLKQTAASRDRTLLNLGGDPQDYVNLGDYAETVYLHDTQNKIEIGVGWKPEDFKNKLITHYSINSCWQFEKELVEHTQITHTIKKNDGESISAKVILQKNEFGKDELVIQTKDETSEDFTDLLTQQRQSKSSSYKRYFYEFPVDALSNAVVLKLIDSTEISFRSLLNQIHYLGPLRAQPKREYRWLGEGTTSLGVSGEYTIESILTEQRRPFGIAPLKQINRWLKRLGVADKLNIQRISDTSSLFEVRIHTDSSDNYANLVDVGFGVSQVLPIVALAYLAPPESIIILEQPELHLHPRVQAELADLFLEAAQTRNIQFIIESHSEHLLARLQRRLAERSGANEHLNEDDVRLYFCQREGSESTLQPLQMDEYGRIQNWPPDFFGDLLDERLKAMEAMVIRQQKAHVNGHMTH